MKTIIRAYVAVVAIGSGLSCGFVEQTDVVLFNENPNNVYRSSGSQFRGVYGRISRGTGVLGGRSSSTSDGTSRLELGRMQWFNEPTVTVNLIKRPESQ